MPGRAIVWTRKATALEQQHWQGAGQAVATPCLFPKLWSIHLQGTGQTMVVNWGDGFFTDADVLANYQGMSNPNNFFTTIVGMPYINQVGPAPATAALVSQPCLHQAGTPR